MPTSTERIRSHQGYFGRDRAHRQGRAHRGHRRGQGLRCGAYISAFPRAGKLLRESWGRIPQLAPCDFHGQLRKRRPHCVAVLPVHDPKSRPRSQQPRFTEGSGCEMDSEASVGRSAGVWQRRSEDRVLPGLPGAWMCRRRLRESLRVSVDRPQRPTGRDAYPHRQASPNGSCGGVRLRGRDKTSRCKDIDQTAHPPAGSAAGGGATTRPL